MNSNDDPRELAEHARTLEQHLAAIVGPLLGARRIVLNIQVEIDLDDPEGGIIQRVSKNGLNITKDSGDYMSRDSTAWLIASDKDEGWDLSLVYNTW